MRIFGFDSVGGLIGYPVIEFYRNKKDRGILVDAVMQRGRITDVPVALVKRDGSPIWCAVTARGVLDDDGMVVHIDGMLKDISGRMVQQKSDLNQDKLEGVLEMAGGVAHRLNQPLTVVNNLLDEVIAECRSDAIVYEKMKIIRSQIQKMNDITKKISNVKKYAAMDYVAGVKIVDLDRAS
jgi:signal transduction histidine kinase